MIFRQGGTRGRRQRRRSAEFRIWSELDLGKLQHALHPCGGAGFKGLRLCCQPPCTNIRVILACLGAVFGPSWGHLGAILGHLEAMLGPCWGHVGVILGSSWGHLGAIVVCIGAILSCANLEGILGAFGGYIGPCSAKVERRMGCWVRCVKNPNFLEQIHAVRRSISLTARAANCCYCYCDCCCCCCNYCNYFCCSCYHHRHRAVLSHIGAIQGHIEAMLASSWAS
jgi:hypothetical protein